MTFVQVLSKSVRVRMTKSWLFVGGCRCLEILLSNLAVQLKHKLRIVDSFQGRWRFERLVEPGIEITINKELMTQ